MKKYLLVILLVFVLALSVTLAACEHTHTYEDNWSYDVNTHFHKPTCDDTDEVADEAPHIMRDVVGTNMEECSVCGYTRLKKANTTDEHQHTYAAAYSADDNGHWRAATCEHSTEIIDSAKHTYTDGICKECGWWSSATEVMLAELSKLQVWDYAVTLSDVDLSGFSEQTQDMVISDGELKLSVSSDGQFDGCGYFALADGHSVKVVVRDSVAYAQMDGNCFRGDVAELLSQYGVDVEQITALTDELNANTAAIRNYVEQLLQLTDYLPDDAASKLLNALVKEDEASSTDNLTAYVIDYDVLRNVNQTLASATVAEYVDVMFGEGFFANLPQFVEDLFDLRVYQIFDMIEKNFGLTFDEVFELIDKLIAGYYPDDNVNTIDQLVAANGGDLKGVSVKELVRLNKLSRLEFILDMAQIKSDNPITVDQIVDTVRALCDAYGDKTIYQLISEQGGEMTVEQLTQMVEQVITAAEAMPATFFVDNDGILQQITINGEVGSVVIIRGQELTQDYSHVIDEVNSQLDAAA